MSNNILDEHLIQPKKRRIPAVRWVGLVYLWLCVLLLFTSGFVNTSSISLAAVVLVSTIIYYFNKRISAIVVAIILTLASINFISISPISLLFPFYFIWIEVFSFIMLCIHFTMNRDDIQDFVEYLRVGTAEEQQAVKNSKIESFKRRYANKSSYELKNLAQNSALLPEARQAAQELLEEKEV